MDGLTVGGRQVPDGAQFYGQQGWKDFKHHKERRPWRSVPGQGKERIRTAFRFKIHSVKNKTQVQT